jgi:hypothetical protein
MSRSSELKCVSFRSATTKVADVAFALHSLYRYSQETRRNKPRRFLEISALEGHKAAWPPGAWMYFSPFVFLPQPMYQKIRLEVKS